MFSQFELAKELKLLFTFGVIILLVYSALREYYYTLYVQGQPQQQLQLVLPPSPTTGVKITSPTTGQQVPVGELTISGISIDNATTDCIVYADGNDQKPYQPAVATGPGGVNDYSTWNFTYTPEYHPIANGTNQLTARLSCIDGDINNIDNNNAGSANITKSYSVDVIGIGEFSESGISGSTTGSTGGGAGADVGGGTTEDTGGGARGDTIKSPYGDPSRGTTGSIISSQ